MQDVELTWADRLRQEGREKGLEEGRERGVEEGVIEGKRQALKRLVSHRFGPLPVEAEVRIDAVTSADDLDRYLEQVLSANSLREMGLG